MLLSTRVIGKYVFAALDETRDALGRAMTVILLGIFEEEQSKKPFLIDLVDVQTPNFSSIQQAITSALHSLLEDDKVKLLLTNGASYCLKAGNALKGIFTELIHITCICHALKRVAELARTTYPKVSVLIAEIKKIFVKSTQR